MASEDKKLRFITYLSPNSMPIEYYQCLQEYLEEKLAIESYLIYESRWEGPPKQHCDPFTLDDVDIGFISSSSFIRLYDAKNPYVELVPVAPTIEHSLVQGRPVYFTDVILPASSKIDKFEGLKGHNWAYSSEDSISAYENTLQQLKKFGENASYFGNVLESGSHQNSIRMVIDGSADAAPISSTFLVNYLKARPEIKDRIKVLTSWGPLPNHPIVINSRLSKNRNMKEKIAELLLAMPKDQRWRDKLAKFSVFGFVSTELTLYKKEVDLRSNTKNLNMKPIYY